MLCFSPFEKFKKEKKQRERELKLSFIHYSNNRQRPGFHNQNKLENSQST